MSISKKIRLLRFNNNDTPAKDLAKALDISKETIYNYESGKVKPSLERLIEIAAFFKVDVSYFDEDVEDLQNENFILQNKTQKESEENYWRSEVETWKAQAEHWRKIAFEKLGILEKFRVYPSVQV